MSRRAALAAAVLVSLAHVAGARAGACPGPHLTVLPSGAAPVPTNVELRVVFDASTAEAIELVDDQTRQIAASGMVAAATAEIAIRDAAGADVKATVQRPPDAVYPIVIVKPDAALAPGAAYAVVVRDGGKEYVVSRFTTAAGPEETVPDFAPDKVTYYRWKRSRHPHWKDPSGTFAEITAGASAHVSGLEILAGDPATLRTIVPFSLAAPRFGSLDACRAPTFVFPPGTAPVHLWIRAFDRAGHLGTLHERIVDRKRARTYAP